MVVHVWHKLIYWWWSTSIYSNLWHIALTMIGCDQLWGDWLVKQLGMQCTWPVKPWSLDRMVTNDNNLVGKFVALQFWSQAKCLLLSQIYDYLYYRLVCKSQIDLSQYILLPKLVCYVFLRKQYDDCLVSGLPLHHLCLWAICLHVTFKSVSGFQSDGRWHCLCPSLVQLSQYNTLGLILCLWDIILVNSETRAGIMMLQTSRSILTVALRLLCDCLRPCSVLSGHLLACSCMLCGALF